VVVAKAIVGRRSAINKRRERLSTIPIPPKIIQIHPTLYTTGCPDQLLSVFILI
jgi:hypothetical protein